MLKFKNWKLEICSSKGELTIYPLRNMAFKSFLLDSNGDTSLLSQGNGHIYLNDITQE